MTHDKAFISKECPMTKSGCLQSLLAPGNLSLLYHWRFVIGR